MCVYMYIYIYIYILISLSFTYTVCRLILLNVFQPGKKKKFIDKKNAVTFHLVHRSQRDPLQAADDVPQRVLLPANAGQKSVRYYTLSRFNCYN